MEQLLISLALISILMFIVILAISIIGLFQRKKWVRKSLMMLLFPIIVFVLCDKTDSYINNVSNQAEGRLEDSQKRVSVDFNEFTYHIEKSNYNKDGNAIDIELSTNIPDGTIVNIGFNKMIVTEEGINDFDDPIIESLNWGRELLKVVDSKISLHYDGSEIGTQIINGEYGIWLDFEVGSNINQDLFEELGSIEGAKNRFVANTITESVDEGEYSVILGQQFLDIKNSISYKELKQLEQNKIVQKKTRAKEIRFAEVDKNPDKYYGEFVKYEGQILQIMEDSTSTEIRLAVTKDSNGYDYDDVIYITYVGATPFVEDDEVTVYGIVKGSHTYESQAGHQITLPLMEAEIIE
jgi:hypothetical protein